MTTKKDNPKLLAEKVNETATEVKQPSVDELQKRINELEKKLLSTPQTLEDKIKYLQTKQQLVKKLNLLNMYRDNINEFIQAINEEVETDILTNENFYVEFYAKDNESHRTREILKIQNPIVVLELFKFASDKISEQITNTAKEINE